MGGLHEFAAATAKAQALDTLLDMVADRVADRIMARWKRDGVVEASAEPAPQAAVVAAPAFAPAPAAPAVVEATPTIAPMPTASPMNPSPGMRAPNVPVPGGMGIFPGMPVASASPPSTSPQGPLPQRPFPVMPTPGASSTQGQGERPAVPNNNLR